MNLLGFIMSLVYMQAVHGRLSTYERLVNSQFFPYLIQEDLSRLVRITSKRASSISILSFSNAEHD